MNMSTQPALTPHSKFELACPARKALEVVSSKWVLLIIPALEQGVMRNNQLLRKIEGISQKMLTQTLKELERSGIVVRTDHSTVPPKVEYHLSALGKSLSAALVPLDQWAETHHPQLVDARKAFDASNPPL